MEKFSIANIVPKKLKLSDYELGQTLGTGNFKLYRFIWQSQDCYLQNLKETLRNKNFKEI